MSNASKLKKSVWFNIVLFGFMGQVAWAVENVYFNTFLFNKIGGTTDNISTMVALSAVTAVVTTLIMGALSDKLNRRKLFLAGGYIVWGLTVCTFALISREHIGGLLGMPANSARVVLATVSIVIIMDCVMTFFGSTSNDAAFNAWVTDITDVSNRGTVESVLAILPVAATVIVTAAFGILVDSMGYGVCFVGLGIVVTLCGIIGLFTVKDSLSGEKRQESYWKDLVYGFKPKTVKENKQLYIILFGTAIFNTAVQVFMPYIFIYLQHYLNFDFNAVFGTIAEKPYIIAIAAVAVVGLVAVMIGLGKMIDKLGKARFIFISAILFIIGLICVSFAKTLSVFGLFALIMVAGYGLLMIILNASVRDFTPDGMAGRFQGIRMIFMVLIPMVIGPKVGTTVIKYFNTGITYANEYGQATAIPVPQMFLASAIIAVLIFIPLVLVRKDLKKVNL